MRPQLSTRTITQTYLKVLLIMLAVEAMIMAYFIIYPNTLHEWQEAILDVLLLALISTPLVYLLVVKPYEKLTNAAIEAEEEAKAKLVDLIKSLEFEKKTLDEHASVSISNSEGSIFYVNSKFVELSGYSESELLKQNHRILSSGHHSTAFFKQLWTTISRGKVWHGEIKNQAKNGSYYWVQTTIVPFNDDNGLPFQYVAVQTDITMQKKLEETFNRAQNVANIGNWSFEIPSNQLTWSDQIYDIFGIDPETFQPSLEGFYNTIHPDDIEYVKEQYERSLSGEFPYDIEHRIIRQDTGEVRWVNEKCIHQLNEKDEVIRSDGTVQDITEQKQIQEELQQLAMTDSLTGLANRNQFFIHFESLLKIAKRENQQLALLLLDLDKFKPINDTFGHQTGDEVLRAVAKIFKHSCRETDIAARIGGDEFAILLFNPDGLQAIENIVQRILKEINKPINIFGNDISIGISIGISRYPMDGKTHDVLIEKADLALYTVKHSGRNDFSIYEHKS